jgi:hypothetical protein
MSTKNTLPSQKIVILFAGTPRRAIAAFVDLHPGFQAFVAQLLY